MCPFCQEEDIFYILKAPSPYNFQIPPPICLNSKQSNFFTIVNSYWQEDWDNNRDMFALGDLEAEKVN